MIQRLYRSRFFRFATGIVAGAALLAACTQMPQNRGETAAMSATPSAAPAAPAPAQLGTQWGEGIESKTRTIVTSGCPSSPTKWLRWATTKRPPCAATWATTPSAASTCSWPRATSNGRCSTRATARCRCSARAAAVAAAAAADVFRLAGVEGARYTLRFRNLSDRSYEVIATVDGLDVLTGKSGSLRNGGYVLRPQETINIEGFRKSQSEVAAFRFATPGRAYAANTEAGDVRNIGVIGAALFELEQPQARRPRRDATPPQPSAFPADGAYAPPPRYRK
jgi:hypothetical protein